MTPPTRRAFLGASLAALSSSPAYPATEPDPSADDTLFLTWQRDPTTTMTAQWIAPAKGAASVWFRPAEPPKRPTLALTGGTAVLFPAAPWELAPPVAVTPYPKTAYSVHRCELTGLEPGTWYEFRVGASGTPRRFRTMPAKATDTISFISGGDCGTGPHAVANNVQAARQDPLFAVVGGDLGYDNGTSARTSIAFFRNWSKSMIARGNRLIPMLPCIGNHEVEGGYGKPRAKAPFFYALFDGLFPETGYRALDVGDYLSLILLDTGHTSAIDGEQTSWLDRTLRERKDRPHVLAVNHVPAYPSARLMEGPAGKAGTGELNRKHWVPLFEKHRVPVVLEHHDHTFKRTKPLLGGLERRDGVLYLGDGSWGKLRAPQPPEKLGHLAALDQDYHLSLHRLEGEERFHLALGEDGRVMDAARTGQRGAGLVRVGG